jgi:TonB family protein
MKNIILLFLILITFGLTTKAQSNTAKWVRVETDDKEFSLALPDGFSVLIDNIIRKTGLDEKPETVVVFKNIRSLTAFSDATSMWLDSYDVSNVKKGLDRLYRKTTNSAVVKEYKTPEFFIREVAIPFARVFYFVSQTRIYVVGVGTRHPENETAGKFLNSIRLNGKPAFTLNSSKPEIASETVSLMSLAQTPVSITVETKKKGVEKAPPTVKPQENQGQGADRHPAGDKPDGQGVTIFWRDPATYTDEARRHNVEGTIKLRLKFDQTGQVTDVSVIEGLGYGLTENAVMSARRIRFLPAEANGKFVSVSKMIEFSFYIY